MMGLDTLETCRGWWNILNYKLCIKLVFLYTTVIHSSHVSLNVLFSTLSTSYKCYDLCLPFNYHKCTSASLLSVCALPLSSHLLSSNYKLHALKVSFIILKSLILLWNSQPLIKCSKCINMYKRNATGPIKHEFYRISTSIIISLGFILILRPIRFVIPKVASFLQLYLLTQLLAPRSTVLL